MFYDMDYIEHPNACANLSIKFELEVLEATTLESLESLDLTNFLEFIRNAQM
jgi:hypothetical protein